ncbi:hypothetical protein CCAX7_20910 [Capsulimonas corticalis]|uniref:Uncharacterized protein n=1 Tax=Capsulimonas corticalis TaxID=2219043 RepID=A0A402D2D8_9BACT|nr:GNAT family N-acetyltransferase [Capsulimonas corticalis]BDI30040.1 hypothetical protein CCAX7_20910 [Capsulimonas corticalis]
MNIQVVPAAYTMKPVLRRLLELYEYDASEFDHRDLDAQGLYGYRYLDHYWTEEGRYAFFIRVSDALAGFALVRTLDSPPGPAVYSMAEFFVLRKYRRAGVGRAAARQLFDRFHGRWSVSQEANNLPAQQFWKRVIGEYSHGAYEESRADTGPLLLFDSSEISGQAE